jgi:hypothetical protein
MIPQVSRIIVWLVIILYSGNILRFIVGEAMPISRYRINSIFITSLIILLVLILSHFFVLLSKESPDKAYFVYIIIITAVCFGLYIYGACVFGDCFSPT